MNKATKIILVICLKICFGAAAIDYAAMLVIGRFKIPHSLAHVIELFIMVAVLMFFAYFIFLRPLKKILALIEEAEATNRYSVRSPFSSVLTVEAMASAVDRIVKTARENAAMLTQITNGVDEAIMLLDKDFKILWANKKIMELSHLSVGDVLGKFCYKITHHLDEPCKPPHDICPVHEVIASGKPITSLHIHRDKDGAAFYAEVTAYPVRDASGEISRFIHIARNVTEKIKMIEELRAAKDKLEGYSGSLEKMVEEKTVDLRQSVERSGKQRLAILNILEDVNLARKELTKLNAELRQAQAQLVQSAKMAAVGQLASGVAHEINNPLTGVLNNLQLIKMEIEMRKDFGIDEFKDLLNIIEESALRCKKITHYLLDFSHASAETMRPFALNETIEKVVTLIEHEMKLENIMIKRELDPAVPQVLGDRQLFQQVIFNLIYNAKWAVEKKSGKIGGVIMLKTEKFPDKVIVSISDTGIGIPKENIDKLFEPFFTTKPVGEGTGLGLALAYSIIQKHKGMIEIESEVGIGTTFKVILPV